MKTGPIINTNFQFQITKHSLNTNNKTPYIPAKKHTELNDVKKFNNATTIQNSKTTP